MRLRPFPKSGNLILMRANSRTTIGLAVTGLVFLFAGLRDRYWPGHLTLDANPPNRVEIGVAMTFALIFLGAAAFRLIRSKPKP